MAAKEISVKRYVVRLSADEREQLEALIRKGKSPKAGRPARFDYEYERNGTANLFMMFRHRDGRLSHSVAL